MQMPGTPELRTLTTNLRVVVHIYMKSDNQSGVPRLVLVDRDDQDLMQRYSEKSPRLMKSQRLLSPQEWKKTPSVQQRIVNDAESISILGSLQESGLAGRR